MRSRGIKGSVADHPNFGAHVSDSAVELREKGGENLATEAGTWDRSLLGGLIRDHQNDVLSHHVDN